MNFLKDIRVLARVEISLLLKSKMSIGQKIKYFAEQWKNIFLDLREVEYFGKTFSYDKRTEPMLLGEYPEEIERIIKHIQNKKIMTAIDIGANIGQWGFTIKSKIPSIKLYSFEPNPKPFNVLKKNSERMKGWETFNYGIDEKDGKRKMYYSPQATAEGTYHKENINQNYVRKNIKEETIKTIVLNKKNMEKMGIPNIVDLVKIDVEGAEMEVLKGIKELNFRYLYIETSIARKGSSKNEVISFLEKKWNKKVRLIFSNKPSKESTCENSLIEVL